MRVISFLALLGVAAAPALAQPLHTTVYRSVEIAPFSVDLAAFPGDVMPEDYRLLVETELVKAFAALKKCDLVARESSHAELPEPALRLVGTYTIFKPGNRAKRTLGLPGTGTTKLVAHVQFLDKNTGATLAEGDVAGAIKGGGLVGCVASRATFCDLGAESSLDSTRLLARQIVKMARKNFFH